MSFPIEPLEPLTVRDLIEHLGTFDPSLLVAYRMFSENCLLEASDISVSELGEPRPDGWVANARPDKPTRTYLLFPGN